MTDYYACLGIPRNATAAAIRAAYRKLALQLHPDRNPGDRVAEAKFKVVAQAYNVLSDERQRAIYDRDTARPAPRPEPWRARTTVWGASPAFGTPTTVFTTGPVELGKRIPVDISGLRVGQVVIVNFGFGPMPAVFMRKG